MKLFDYGIRAFGIGSLTATIGSVVTGHLCLSQKESCQRIAGFFQRTMETKGQISEKDFVNGGSLIYRALDFLKKQYLDPTRTHDFNEDDANLFLKTQKCPLMNAEPLSCGWHSTALAISAGVFFLTLGVYAVRKYMPIIRKAMPQVEEPVGFAPAETRVRAVRVRNVHNDVRPPTEPATIKAVNYTPARGDVEGEQNRDAHIRRQQETRSRKIAKRS